MFLALERVCSCRGDALGVVREERARAPAAEAVLGAVPGALDVGEAGEAAEALNL